MEGAYLAMGALQGAIRATGEIVSWLLLATLWPVLHVASLIRPAPFPPWLTPILESPWRSPARIMERSGLELIGDTVIPVELKDATALYAQALMVADRTADSDIETLGITSLSAGPVSLSFESSVRAKPIPDSVRAMIPTWWGWLRGAGMREVLRG